MDIKEEEEEIQKEFQLERAILFTDAVFAIILTIMVLDIKLPEGTRHASEPGVKHAFKELIFKFLGYALTFALVARFWVGHLKLFRPLKDYDAKLLALNLVFLFTITLFPFAVSLITGSVNPDLPEFTWGWTIYIWVIYSAIFTQSLITRYLLKHKDKLCLNISNLEQDLKWKIARINLVLMPVLVIIIFIFTYLGLSVYYAMYTAVAYGVLTGRLSRKYYPGKNDGPLIAGLYRYVKSKRLKKRTVIVPADKG